MLERLEKIIGADELTSTVEFMQRGMQYGTFDLSEQGCEDEGRDEDEDEEDEAASADKVLCLLATSAMQTPRMMGKS
jgi:hypothetical protein